MFLEDDLLIPANQRDSVVAVIKPYRDRTLAIKPNWTSYWCNGQMVRSLGPADSLEVESDFVGLYATSGKGRVWVEAVSIIYFYLSCIISLQ